MDNMLSTIGLAYRAKKIVLGEEVLNQINDVKLMIIVTDISQSSLNRFIKKCDYYNIPYIQKYSCEQLSNALGKTTIKVIGIIDEGFKKILLK